MKYYRFISAFLSALILRTSWYDLKKIIIIRSAVQCFKLTFIEDTEQPCFRSGTSRPLHFIILPWARPSSSTAATTAEAEGGGGDILVCHPHLALITLYNAVNHMILTTLHQCYYLTIIGHLWFYRWLFLVGLSGGDYLVRWTHTVVMCHMERKCFISFVNDNFTSHILILLFSDQHKSTYVCYLTVY